MEQSPMKRDQLINTAKLLVPGDKSLLAMEKRAP
jgi:hypothetical protein